MGNINKYKIYVIFKFARSEQTLCVYTDKVEPSYYHLGIIPELQHYIGLPAKFRTKILARIALKRSINVYDYIRNWKRSNPLGSCKIIITEKIIQQTQ